MCRMFAYVGNSYQELTMLYKALINSAENDIIGKKYGYSSHRDGYGMVISSESNLFHYRSSRPIFDDPIKLPEFEGKIYAIFHAMNAYNKSMISPVFEHPFTGSNGNDVLYMAHNGVVDKDAIMKELKINGIYNDTEAALQYVVMKGIDGLDGLENYTISSLNIAILKINKNNNKNKVYFKNFFKDQTKRDYLEMYTTVMTHGNAVISSTLKFYGIDNAFTVESSKVVDLEII